MADLIKVDTERVAAAANNIAHYNNKIRDDFAAVESAIKAMGQEWTGGASMQAISSFHSIKDASYEPRYTVVNNYVNFLQKQVNPGYIQTETTNTALADAFK